VNESSNEGVTMRVAVAGGTGVVGRKVVERLEQQGHDAVVLARSRGMDLTTGHGLDEALRGVDAVIDVSNSGSTRRKTAVGFFTTVSKNLLEAEAKNSVRHHVALSIVGIDGIKFGYHQGKVAQEAVVAAGQVPWSILRVTQFHEFPAQILAQTAVGPVSFVPQMLSQPVSAEEVADALVELALGEPVGRAPDLGGPGQEQIVDMARRIARHGDTKRVVVPIRFPGSVGRAMRDGSLLPKEPGPRGTQTFTEWLETSAAKA
jgi:uncharacterized protein YbjT (DUF2867 family)